MRALLWTIVALFAVLGLGGLIAWLNSAGPQLGHQAIRLMPTVSATPHNPEPSNFRAGERVFHNNFGNGTVVATDGPKLTIEFDEGGMKRVVDSFVIKSDDSHPAK